MQKPGVAVLMPVYNEADMVGDVVAGIVDEMQRTGLDYELRVINDGSSDWTPDLEAQLTSRGNVCVHNLYPNRGKGAALDGMLSRVEMQWTVVIDADNEYSCADIRKIIDPLAADRADWVMGSRYGFGRNRPRQYLLTYAVNMLFNRFFHLLSGVRFNDILTGLYGFRTEMVDGVRLEQERFAYTPELIWKVLRMRHPRWLDVPVSYRYRTYSEGKTIRWWETFTILYCMLKYKYARVDAANGSAAV